MSQPNKSRTSDVGTLRCVTVFCRMDAKGILKWLDYMLELLQLIKLFNFYLRTWTVTQRAEVVWRPAQMFAVGGSRRCGPACLFGQPAVEKSSVNTHEQCPLQPGELHCLPWCGLGLGDLCAAGFCSGWKPRTFTLMIFNDGGRLGQMAAAVVKNAEICMKVWHFSFAANEHWHRTDTLRCGIAHCGRNTSGSWAALLCKWQRICFRKDMMHSWVKSLPVCGRLPCTCLCLHHFN